MSEKKRNVLIYQHRVATFFQNDIQHLRKKKTKRKEKKLVKVYIFYNGGCWHCNCLWTFILVYPPFDLPLHHRPSGSWCGPGRWGAALFWDETDSLFISSCQTEYCLICSFSMSSIFGQMTSAQQRLLLQSHHSQACWKSKERVMARKWIVLHLQPFTLEAYKNVL